MKCQKCQGEIFSRPLQVVGMDGFTVDGFICVREDCELHGLPVLIEMISTEYEPIDRDCRVPILSETLKEPDYLHYQSHKLPIRVQE